MNRLQLEKIVCFGEVLWDMIPAGAQPGGAPMNAAIHLKRQGLNPVIVSSVGDDEAGRALKDFLNAENLSLEYLQIDAELPTGKVLVYLDDNKNARYDIIEPVAWDNIQYNEELELLASGADIVLFGTLASRNEVTRNTLLRLLKKTNAVKLLDINLRPPYDNRATVEPFLHLADFVKLNDDELRRVAEWNSKTGSERELAAWVSKHYNCCTVCVTRGAAGALLLMEETFMEHTGFKVQAADTVGAGDAFLAALIAGLSKGNSARAALAGASATGAFVASHHGAVPPYTPHEIATLFPTTTP